MTFHQPTADVFVPDGTPMPEALARTTHLCVGAHQDDQEFMAFHGIAECFRQPDKWFAGVIATNGAGSPRAGIYADYTNEAMMQVRVREQRMAAFTGEYGCQIQLMHPSSAVKTGAVAAVVADLKAIFEIARPRVVYLHNPADKHDTHVAVFLRALEALRALPPDARPERVYACECWRDLDWLQNDDKCVLPVDRFKNVAAAVSGVFDSQISGGKRYDTAVAGRRAAHATFLESHATDTSDAVDYAMDATALVHDPTIDVAAFTRELIHRFEKDVMKRIAELSPR